MNLFNFHVFRLVATALLLPLLRNRVSVLGLLIVLIVLDWLDCIPVPKSYCGTHNYQRMDKLVDVTAYTYAALVFGYLFDTRTMGLLVAFIALRAIGVYKYQHANNNRILYMYPDFVNSTMLVFYLSTISPFVYDNYYACILLGIVFKVFYELLHHSTPYIVLRNGYHASSDDLVAFYQNQEKQNGRYNIERPAPL